MKKSKLINVLIPTTLALTTTGVVLPLASCAKETPVVKDKVSLGSDANQTLDDNNEATFTLKLDNDYDNVQVAFDGEHSDWFKTTKIAHLKDTVTIRVQFLSTVNEDTTFPFRFSVTTSSWTAPSPDVSVNVLAKTEQETVDKIDAILVAASTIPTVMSDLISLLKENEIDLEALTTNDTTSQWVWDSEANKVFVLNKDGTIKCAPKGYILNQHKVNIWKMVAGNKTSYLRSSLKEGSINKDPFSSTCEYSQYLRTGEQFTTKLEFCSGLDTGSITNLELTFVANESQEVIDEPAIINTNGGILTVNSTSFTNIEHYGSLLDLKLNSLQESGTFETSGKIVGDVVIASGVDATFVASEDATVNTIYVADPETKIEVDSNEVGTIIPTTPAATAAINDIVDISEEVTSEPEIEHQEAPAPQPETTELSGLGTERSPYIVSDKADFVKMHQYVSKGYKYYVFENTNKVIDGSDWETNGYYGNLYGSFDGNGLVINDLSRPLFNVVGDVNSTDDEVMKISNVTLNCDITLPSSTAGVARTLDKNAIFKKVDVHGYVSGAVHVGGYVCYGPRNIHESGQISDVTANWQFIECHCDAMISGTGSNPYVSAFVAHRYANDDSIYTFNDSIFNGVINNVNSFTEDESSCYYGYFITGPIEYSAKVRTHYSTDFIAEYGNPENVNYKLPSQTITEVIGDVEYKSFYTGTDASLSTRDPNYEARKDYYVRTGYIANDMRHQMTFTTCELTPGTVQTLEVEKQAGAQIAYASLFIGPNGKNGDSNLLKSFEYEKMSESELGQTIKYTSSVIKNFNIFVNQTGHETQGVQGDDYNVYDTDLYQTTANPQKYILVIQYKPDNAGRLIPFHTTKFTW